MLKQKSPKQRAQNNGSSPPPRTSRETGRSHLKYIHYTTERETVIGRVAAIKHTDDGLANAGSGRVKKQWNGGTSGSQMFPIADGIHALQRQILQGISESCT